MSGVRGCVGQRGEEAEKTPPAQLCAEPHALTLSLPPPRTRGRRADVHHPVLPQRMTTTLHDFTHSHTQTAHGRTHKRVFWWWWWFFFFCLFFFLFTLQRTGQGPVALTQELTNITKILQFVQRSSTPSAWRTGGDPALWGGGRERRPLGLRNSLSFSFPTKIE